MKVYDTLLIGCSYASVGYALNSKNTLIVEQTQSADTRFYLPLRSYNLDAYTPTTEYGKSLLDTFNSFKLIDGEKINANALESAFCDFFCGFYFRAVICLRKQSTANTVKIILYRRTGRM